MKSNYHTHTTWCDGRNTPEEMAEAAIAKGFGRLGFSSHGEMLKDPDAYIADIRALAERYRGRLEIYCGLEANNGDTLGRRDRFDYVIGSVHEVFAGGERIAVDHTPEILQRGIKEHFGGSGKAFVKAYFAAQRRMMIHCDFDILGHPDLVRKFNAKHPFFDEDATWYIEELVNTADEIARHDFPVEVNTGAISRGWLDEAYPSPLFRTLLRERGVRFVLSSDAHSADGLDCAFDRYYDTECFIDIK